VRLKRGPFKYVHCPGDPDQLYDLAQDPDELADLAAGGGHENVLRELAAEAERRWDLERVREDVLASQRRRLLVAHALAAGEQTPWDYAPPDDSRDRYVRGENFWAPFGRARLRGADSRR
jgi:choline-sulfatase